MKRDIRKRVLIVDDLPEQREIYTTLLRINGYEVTEAGDGEAALAAVAKERPDAIVMDVRLPLLDGWRVTAHLKADPLTSGIPILILTACATKGDEEMSASVGADEYLSKPCDPSAVLAAVQNLLKRANLPV